MQAWDPHEKEIMRKKTKSILLAASILVSVAVPAQTTQTNAAQPLSTFRQQYKTTPISMALEAGSGEFRNRPEGGEVHHSGIGYIDPFGRASYSCGLSYPEQKTFPYPEFFTPEWHKAYESDGILFCVYTLQDGNIYTYDSIAGSAEVRPGEYKDEIINVVVGGTGAYKNAVGLWVGHTQGAGEITAVNPTRKLPRSILKLMDGYIRVPRETDANSSANTTEAK
jgi:hypothetical protein